ncbi:MAG: bifunctional isocitrate dehydrogenase kinase/phosphatase, partial [Gammaproteobacteria bacterium HGW-Gammaproteobacteria-7]
IEPTDRITHPVARHSYVAGDDLALLFQRVLSDYPFAVPYADPAACANAMADALRERLGDWGAAPVVALELLQTVFFRERRAYLVGRLFGRERHTPLVIALINDEGGLRVDAVLTERPHVSVLFGYTRSYFHADLPTVGDAVVFLRGLLPNKPVAELYTVLGRAKQGKTERYRDFFHHLGRQGDERFVHADGERGMVMAVFTLPSYPLVFKLIRDKFAFPKNIAREQVREKYDLVFHHDRVGRLVDAQEFRYLRFPRRQFTAALLEELEDGCRHSVLTDGDDLVIVHCYIERRLRPLNLYLREASPAKANLALLDYGQAIKDLARSNIFPGDLLFKNFGISSAGRAVFYDYDELCLVTECKFRHIPEPRYEEDEYAHEAWFHVGENDVFPAQFPRFLGLDAAQRALLLEVHGDIFDVGWWQRTQTELLAGGYADIPPYPDSARVLAAE